MLTTIGFIQIVGTNHTSKFTFHIRPPCRTIILLYTIVISQAWLFSGKKVESVEKRLKSLLDECQRNSASVLILDELDQLCNAGTSLDQLNPGANIFQSRISRGS